MLCSVKEPQISEVVEHTITDDRFEDFFVRTTSVSLTVAVCTGVTLLVDGGDLTSFTVIRKPPSVNRHPKQGRYSMDPLKFLQTRGAYDISQGGVSPV